jgi:hypothetical protein
LVCDLQAAKLPKRFLDGFLHEDLGQKLGRLRELSTLLKAATERENTARVKALETSELDYQMFFGTDALEEMPLTTIVTRIDRALIAGDELLNQTIEDWYTGEISPHPHLPPHRGEGNKGEHLPPCATVLCFDLVWIEYFRELTEVDEMGLGGILKAYEEANAPYVHLVAALTYVFHCTILDQAYKRYPELRRFAGTSLETARRRFQELDRVIIEAKRRQLAAALACVSRHHQPGSAGDLDRRDGPTLRPGSERRGLPQAVGRDP